MAARYRALRESGLVTKGGRGPFAPEMTALDAARLLIAVMGAQAIAETGAITTILGGAECVVCEDDGDGGVLAEAFGDLVFEKAVAKVLQACLAFRLGHPRDYVRMVRGITISLSPTALTATIARDGVVAIFRPTRAAGASSDLAVAERLWRRPDHTGLQIQVSIEAPELLELAPSLGPSNAVYRPTH